MQDQPRQATAEEALDACLGRISEREAEIRAFAHLDAEAARAAARALDARGRPGLLAGMAVGVKDIFDTADMPTGYGSPIYAGHRPAWDAAAVTLIRRAGGVVLGKTVTTEFAWMTPGPTRNPHDAGHTPGGSSSGSAAGVAAGFFPAAIGSQTGGSVIRPAAFCGVVGYKPSYGLVPTAGMKPFAWSLDTVGAFAADVTDAARLGAALTGLAPEFAPEFMSGTPRFGVYLPAAIDRASDDTRAALEQARSLVERAGATVIDAKAPAPFAGIDEAWRIISNSEGARSLAYEFENHADRLSGALREHVEEGFALTPEARLEAQRVAVACRAASPDLFADADVLITPAAPGEAPETLASTGDSVFNRHWTLLGTPCVTVPGLTGNHGLPIGIQLIGRIHDDVRTLVASRWLERQLAG